MNCTFGRQIGAAVGDELSRDPLILLRDNICVSADVCTGPVLSGICSQTRFHPTRVTIQGDGTEIGDWQPEWGSDESSRFAAAHAEVSGRYDGAQCSRRSRLPDDSRSADALPVWRDRFPQHAVLVLQQEYLRADRIAKADLSCGGSYNDSLRRVLRDRLAVRLDWNDFSQLHVLHLPDDAVLEAFVSVIREQPLVTPHTHRRQDGPSGRTRSTRMLRGGAGQIWLLPVPRWVEHRPAFLKGG